MNRLKITLTLFIVFLSAYSLAQTNKGTKVSIIALEAYGNTSSDGEDNFEYRFNTWFNGTYNTNCIDYDNVKKGWHGVKTADQTRVNNVSTTMDASLDLQVEAWEDDGCKGGCSYDTNNSCGGADEAHCGQTSFPFQLYDYVPGNYAGNTVTNYYCTNYGLKFQIIYSPPIPDRPTITINETVLTGASAQLCDNPGVQLTSKIFIKDIFLDHVNYTWQYRIGNETITNWIPNPDYCGDIPYMCDGSGGPLEPLSFQQQASSPGMLALPPPGEEPGNPPCCNEPAYIQQTLPYWRTITGTSNAKINNGAKSFNIRSLPGLTDIKENTSVTFRVMATANGLSSNYSTPSVQVNLSPLAPTITKIEDTPSCPNSKTGIIHLTDVNGPGVYKYNLRPGFDNNAPCDPTQDGSCFSGDISGSASGLDFNIENVPAGEYTLWIVNNGGKTGSCSDTENVKVRSIDKLSLQHLVPPVNVSCNGSSTGEIKLTKTGGITPFTFKLMKGGVTLSTNGTGEFPGLPAGDYVASVEDGCNQNYPETSLDITITQPVKISKSTLHAKKALCESPGNGEVTVVVTKSTGEYDRALPGTFTYHYQLFKDDAPYDSWESTESSWTRSDLPVSANYEMIVTEKGGEDCNGYSESFAIAPPDAMTITTPAIEKVSCFGGDNGQVSFTGSGGSGQYLFKMTKTSGDTIQNTSGSFPALEAGDYTLIIQNNLTGCRDKATHPGKISVTEPKRITVALTKKEISCFGKDDGTLSAEVSEGTPGYTVNWEQYIGTAWSTLNNTTTFIDKRSAGTYRLKVRDSKNCVDSSASVTFIEPALLEIKEVNVHDIKCLNETGRIDIIPVGGTPPHAYAYSPDGGTTFTTFSNETPLNAGTYIVKTTDARGCSFVDQGTHVITAPPSALDFSYAQSDFNGFNISCFGGSNGHAVIVANGGNGADYSSYQYARDGGPFQNDAKVKGFNAGAHSIQVKDGRGCIVSKDAIFTQTAAQLAIDLTRKEDVICFGDITGVLELQGEGGLKPYSFSINDGTGQTSGVFNKLEVGPYQAIITDKNNCTSSASYTIDLLNPAIEISAAVTDVSCFNGSDGAIAVLIGGGVFPFQYSWKDQTRTSANLADLKAGTYTVTVTDNAGCKQESAIPVSQPAKALEASITTIPVCYGRTNGIITITPAGGTSPYRFSIDNGEHYQDNPVFNTVGVGSYAIKVIDSKSCISTGSTTVIQRNDKPEPNFLVATRQNALDTLVVKEISLPKPDSVHWIFDPKATVVNDDPWSPEIIFNAHGTYVITMTGYFQACDYAVTKTLTLNPYDPSNTLPVNEPGYSAIESIEVSPNPNAGEFDVVLALTKKYNLSIIVYDVLGGIHYSKSWAQVEQLNEHIRLDNIASGVYLLRAVTDSDARDVRIVVNR